MNSIEILPLLAASNPESAYGPFARIGILLLCAYILIYFGGNALTAEGRKRNRASLAALMRACGIFLLLALYVSVVYEVLHHRVPHRRARDTWIEVVVFTVVSLGGYWVFKTLVNVLPGRSSSPEVRIERGRDLGTVKEARDAVRRQAAEEARRRRN